VVADGKVTSVPLALELEDTAVASSSDAGTATRRTTSEPSKAIIVIPPAHVDERRDPPPPPPASHRRTYAAVIVTAGTLGIATSVGFGLSARSKYNQARNRCGSSEACPDMATLDQANDDVRVAQRRGNIATIVGAASGAALVGGVVLWLTAPHGVAVSGSASASSAGVTVSGRF